MQGLWARVNETLGKYNKIVEFVASQRKGVYTNIYNATKTGNIGGLDIVEKYCILKDL